MDTPISVDDDCRLTVNGTIVPLLPAAAFQLSEQLIRAATRAIVREAALDAARAQPTR